jgi:putative addiction module killer protein
MNLLNLKKSAAVAFADKKSIEIYQTTDGKEPYTDWFDSIKDVKTQARVMMRIRRLETGNLGDYKALGSGIFELRLDFGPGYRVYFGEKNKKLIILLAGGSKKTQKNDIVIAKQFWENYREIAYEKA